MKLFSFSPLRLSVFFVALFSVFFFSGCQNKENNTDENKISVITSFYPLAFFAQEIAGDNANVINLSGNKSPHSYKISTQDRVKLSQADLVIYQGIGLESWTQDIIPELQKDGVSVLEASHGLHISPRTEEHKNEHEDDEHDEHNEHNKHEEDHHGEFDPHTWIDPVLAQEMAKNIANSLIEIDSQNAQEYKNNLKILIEKLEILDAQYQSGLKNCVQKKAFISHNAFGYLEKRYNFELFPIAGLSPSDEPSAKLLAELQDIAQTQNITHILTEENNVKKYAELLSREVKTTMLSIDPMGKKPATNNYFQTSRNNLHSLSTAFQCQ